jgi:hypothetical protein
MRVGDGNCVGSQCEQYKAFAEERNRIADLLERIKQLEEQIRHHKALPVHHQQAEMSDAKASES